MLVTVVAASESPCALTMKLLFRPGCRPGAGVGCLPFVLSMWVSALICIKPFNWDHIFYMGVLYYLIGELVPQKTLLV